MLKTIRIAVVLIGLAAAGLFSRSSAAEKKDWIKLFNGKDLSGWHAFLDPRSNKAAERIWTVKNACIVCEGSVYGYLLTEKEYADYVLRVQWRWGDKVTRVRNSGVFIHVTGPDKIWPRAVEAQLLANHAGDFWLVDAFQLKVDPARRDPRSAAHYLRIRNNVEKPVGEWNQYEITCNRDTIKLVINGQLVNEGTDAERTRGKILLQSEGAEIYFRNIELRSLR
jgi:hypothetical protein